jgi:hypothetical protein
VRHKDMRPRPWVVYPRGRVVAPWIRKMTRPVDLRTPARPGGLAWFPTASERINFMAHLRMAGMEREIGLRVLSR